MLTFILFPLGVFTILKPASNLLNSNFSLQFLLSFAIAKKACALSFSLKTCPVFPVLTLTEVLIFGYCPKKCVKRIIIIFDLLNKKIKKYAFYTVTIY